MKLHTNFHHGVQIFSPIFSVFAHVYVSCIFLLLKITPPTVCCFLAPYLCLSQLNGKIFCCSLRCINGARDSKRPS